MPSTVTDSLISLWYELHPVTSVITTFFANAWFSVAQWHIVSRIKCIWCWWATVTLTTGPLFCKGLPSFSRQIISERWDIPAIPQALSEALLPFPCLCLSPSSSQVSEGSSLQTFSRLWERLSKENRAHSPTQRGDEGELGFQHLLPVPGQGFLRPNH